MILEVTRSVQGGIKQERKLDVVSNNLANADTSGFKKDSFSFDEQLNLKINKDYSAGAVVLTGNALDFALSGNGFFKIETPDGIKYTRNGNFSLNTNGILVDQNGNPVMGQGGAIAINGADVDTDLSVNQAGEISLNNEVLDAFDIVNFQQMDKMERYGKNMFAYTGETTDEIRADQAVVKHKSLEKSNVAVVEEMVRMIDYHRMFETYSKSIMTFDELDAKAINDVGKLR